MVVGFHGNGREGQIGAVDGDGGCLGESGTRVERLNCRMNGEDRNDEEEEEIDLV